MTDKQIRDALSRVPQQTFWEPEDTVLERTIKRVSLAAMILIAVVTAIGLAGIEPVERLPSEINPELFAQETPDDR